MGHAYLVDGIRTPIGRYGGSLAPVRPDDLAAHVLRGLRDRHSTLDWEAVDDVILGCANQAGEDNRNVARMALLLAGLPQSISGSTVNRLCGSGADALASAARSIRAGEADLVIAGGTESMSRAPYVVGKANSSFDRNQPMYDTTMGWRFINPKLQEMYGTDTMGETAENLADENAVDRLAQDEFALRSQQRTAAKIASGRMAEEILPVTISGRRGVETIVDTDEHPRETTLEKLGQLAPVFRKNGTVTAGNSSGINDGAAALLVASEEAIERYSLTPLARIVGAATAGVPPRIMGIGPVPATQKLLARHQLSINDIDVIELNEAFAAQSLAVLRQLGLPDDAEHVNPGGGAIALGHPLGMSGARLALSAALELKHRRAQRAVVTMCIGVGQGIALLLENA